LGFGCGLLLGYLIRPTELAMVIGGAVGLALGGGVLWAMDKGRKISGQAQVLLVNDPQVLAAYQKLSTCPKATAWKGVF
jgi:ligand-binding sensor protein